MNYIIELELKDGSYYQYDEIFNSLNRAESRAFYIYSQNYKKYTGKYKIIGQFDSFED